MQDLERFADYALAFEMAFASDDWSTLPDHFTPAATYETYGAAPLAGRAAGRDAVIARLRGLVDGLDRRFDRRVPDVLAGPDARDGGIWMRFGLRFERDGLPPLEFSGEHTAIFAEGRIARIEEYVPARECARVEAYLATHAAGLHAPRGALLPPSAATMRRQVAAYAAAKSRQDIEAALALCSDDFRLETVALGTCARGKDEARLQLGIFFTAFPDYAVTVDGMATDDGVLTAWGRARITLAGPLLHFPATGRTAELPFFCVFPFAGGLIAGERFAFDLADLCAQTGLPVEALRAAAYGLAA